MKSIQLAICSVLLLIISTKTVSQNAPQHEKYMVAYYAQWAIYARDYNVSDIKAENITHLMYAFYDTTYDEGADTGGIKSLDPYADYEHTEDPGIDFNSSPAGNIGALKLLKEKYPHLKVLISLGGYTRSQNIPIIARSLNARKTYVESMVKFMQDYPWIDGFDIDWEFPVEGGTDGTEMLNGSTVPEQPHFANDHKNLVYLLKEMRTQFDAAFPSSRKWVTMAGGNNVSNLLKTHVGPGTQVAHGMTENIADFSDFITFFGYDFGGNWFDESCYNAPLYPSNNPEDPLYRTSADSFYTGPGIPHQALDDLITLYLDYLKIPKEKLVMGIPFYGKLFEIDTVVNTDPNNPGLFESAPRTTGICTAPQPPKGSWDSGTCENSGSMGFSDLSQGVATNKHNFLDLNDVTKVSATAAAAGWVRYWDNVAKVPYLYNTTEKKFVSYDDPESINIKVNYALQRDLGGVMIWELSEDSRDDFGGATFANGGATLLKQINTSLVSIKIDISIVFKDSDENSIENVDVVLKNSTGETLATNNSDASGNVVFSQVDGYRSYTIEYQKENFGFLPKNIEIDSEQSSENLSFDIIGSTNLVTLSGTTTLNAVAGSVEVILLDSENKELDRILSGDDGVFTLVNVLSGLDYSLTAEKEYYSFETINITNLTASMASISINGIIDTYSISGTAKDSSGNGIEGVTISLTGGESTQTTTDSGGSYNFTNLEAGKEYNITPSKTGLNFLPSSKTIAKLSEDTTIDFVQNEGYIYGFVKDGQTPLMGFKIQLILNWSSSTLVYVSLEATSDANGMYKFDNQQDGYKISDYAAFTNGGRLEIPAFLAQGYEFIPSSYPLNQIPSSPTQFDFNTQLSAPKITINKPNMSLLTIAVNDTVELEADVIIDPANEDITVDTVTFTIGGQTLTPTNAGNLYTATWTPTTANFNTNHSFVVNASASNDEVDEATFNFTLECSGTGCPNVKPEIVFNKPSGTSFNQPSGFEPIPIEVVATDKDGTIASVTLSINGATPVNLSAGTANTYAYNFTPNSYSEYSLLVTATDSDGEKATKTKVIKVTNSTFVPLPNKVNVGYIHSWDTAAAPFIYLKDVLPTAFNVVVYSFIETEGSDGYTPKLTINDTATDYLTSGVFDKSKLIADIKTLQDGDIPVIVSVGGQNGHVELNTVAQRDIFVTGVIDILREYGFDGLDIDFEGSSMNFGAGALTNFSYGSISAFPKLKNVIDAINMIDDEMGAGFHITAAPEVQYVQQGTTAFVDNWGSFLPVIHNIRENLDYIHVQLYNIGATNGVIGLDGKNYYQGSPDLIVSACESLIVGFKTAGPQIQFQGLRPDQVAIGLPSTDTCSGAGGAAGGGYVTPEDVTKALNYLVNGVSFGGDYTLQGVSYPKFRGAMTWSINWDKTTACGSGVFEYSNNIKAFFEGEDDDNDGVNNADDMCPDTPAGESVNAEGCSSSQLNDDDDDGVINALDECPETPDGEAVDDKGCSSSQLDDDLDGINNDEDNCPNTPTGETVNADGCAESQLDDDGDMDGVNNANDTCPNTPAGEAVDADGCAESQLDNDMDGVNDVDDNCPDTANSNQGDFDSDGLGDVCDDDIDGDGVPNLNDNCDDTPIGDTVGSNGCTVFTLPTSNFQLQISSETCRNSNNGSIAITAVELLNYTAQLTGDGINASNAFTNTTEFNNLEAGNYTACVMIDTQTGYKQCFNITITQPEDLSVYSRVSNSTGKVSLELNGSSKFFIEFNGHLITTTQNEIELELITGINTLKVFTDKDCQGVYRETINNFNTIKIYPNPINDNKLTINTSDALLKTIQVKLYSIIGRVVLSKTYALNNGSATINLPNISKGIFILNVNDGITTTNFKVIKNNKK